MNDTQNAMKEREEDTGGATAEVEVGGAAAAREAGGSRIPRSKDTPRAEMHATGAV